MMRNELFMIALLMAAPLAFAQGMPFPISVKVTPGFSANVLIENLNTGESVMTKTDNGGYLTFDWTPEYFVGKGHTFKISLPDLAVSREYKVEAVDTPLPIAEFKLQATGRCVVSKNVDYEESYVLNTDECLVSFTGPKKPAPMTETAALGFLGGALAGGATIFIYKRKKDGKLTVKKKGGN